MDRALNAVHLAPVPVYDDSDPTQITFSIVDYTLVVEQLRSSLYDPYNYGPLLAAGIVGLEQGNGSIALGNSRQALIDSFAVDPCSPESSGPFQAGLLDTEVPITCGDGLVSELKTFEQSYAAYQEGLKASPLFGTAWYNEFGGPCAYVEQLSSILMADWNCLLLAL